MSKLFLLLLLILIGCGGGSKTESKVEEEVTPEPKETNIKIEVKTSVAEDYSKYYYVLYFTESDDYFSCYIFIDGIEFDRIGIDYHNEQQTISRDSKVKTIDIKLIRAGEEGYCKEVTFNF